jgi:hypothetical protein
MPPFNNKDGKLPIGVKNSEAVAAGKITALR